MEANQTSDKEEYYDKALDYTTSKSMKLFGHAVYGISILLCVAFLISFLGLDSETDDEDTFLIILDSVDFVMPVLVIAMLMCLLYTLKGSQAEESTTKWFFAAMIYEVWELIQDIGGIELTGVSEWIDWIVFAAIYVSLGWRLLTYKSTESLGIALIVMPLLVGLSYLLLSTDWIYSLEITKRRHKSGMPVYILVTMLIPLSVLYVAHEFRKFCLKRAPEAEDEESTEEVAE